MSAQLPALLRACRQRRCPVCDKPDWCLVAEDGSRAICQRVESTKRAGEAGWLHILDGSRRSGAHRPTISVELRRGDFGLYAANAAGFRRSDDADGLHRLQNETGVSVPSLERLGVGHNGWAWTFPMCTPTGRVVGIRLRKSDGSKLAVKGSSEGLFIPSGIDVAGRLLVVEGPTDTAAALDLGFSAIGRPSCTGGSRWVRQFVEAHRPAEVVVFADADEPGRAGAGSLARTLASFTRVRIAEPPDGIKDLRAWLRAGARHDDVVRRVDRADVVQLRAEVRS